MKAILIHFLDSGIPVLQFIGDSDREVAFLRDWADKNLNVKVEGHIPAIAPAESVSLAGGKCARLCPTLSETTAAFGFHVEG